MAEVPKESQWAIPLRRGEDVTKPWSERVPQAIGLVVLGVSVLVAWQRHEFSHPNFGLGLIALITIPWIFDACEWPRFLMEARRLDWVLIVSWTLLVLGCEFWLAAGYSVTDDFAPFFVTVLVGEMASVVGPRFGAAVWVAAVGELILLTNVGHATGEGIWGFAFTIAWLGGTGFRHQVMVSFELAQAQAELAERAAEDERHRLARDIHDLIAHSLAVTMLQLSGARLALRAGDTDDAMAALEDAEAAGRSAMAEIHRTVGLLASSDYDPAQPATPGVTDVAALVASYRNAGLRVALAIEGALDLVPLATGLATYRVVQESLANVVKHAPGAPVTVVLTISAQTVNIAVTNPIVPNAPKAPGGGNGLRGMAERTELLGGSAVAGNGEGSWKVTASIPLAAAR